MLHDFFSVSFKVLWPNLHQEFLARKFFKIVLDREVPAPKSQLLQGWVRQSLLWRKSPAFLVESIEHPSQYTLVSEKTRLPLVSISRMGRSSSGAVGGSIDQLELTDNRLTWSRSWARLTPTTQNILISKKLDILKFPLIHFLILQEED